MPALPPSQIPRLPQLPADTLQVPETEHSPIETPSIPTPTFTPEAPQIEASVFVSEFSFIGNTVFTNEQLLEVAQPYLNREVSFTELVQLRSEITDLYINSGYTTSGAYLPIEDNQAVDVRSAHDCAPDCRRHGRRNRLQRRRTTEPICEGRDWRRRLHPY